MSPEVLSPALSYLREGWDLVIGSRAHAESSILEPQPIYRRLCARLFNLCRDLLLGREIARFVDTQCGFKACEGEKARKLFSRMRIDGFMFDVEMLYLAARQGWKILEMPMRWSNVHGSKVRFFSDAYRTFRDLFCIRWRHAGSRP